LGRRKSQESGDEHEPHPPRMTEVQTLGNDMPTPTRSQKAKM
jgi:hypothetical protein